jgi:hypothetical protein
LLLGNSFPNKLFKSTAYLPSPGGCKKVPAGASEQLLRRWQRPKDDPGTKGCFRSRFIKMEPAEDKVTLEGSEKPFFFFSLIQGLALADLELTM